MLGYYKELLREDYKNQINKFEIGAMLNQYMCSQTPMKQLSEFISPMQEQWLLEKAEPYMFNWFVDILNLEQDRRKMPSFLNKYCYKEEHEYNPKELHV